MFSVLMKNNINNALESLRNGKFVLVYDADGREEETDFIMASQFVTPESIKIMRKEGGGLIFLMVANEIGGKFELPFMTDLYLKNYESYEVIKALIPNDIPYDTKSSFSLTINHRKTFTGITDNDRALTMSEFSKIAQETVSIENVHAIELFGKNFRSPGHIPICMASSNPLKSRFGHTELSVALLKMADLLPVSSGCEMMGDNGKSLPKEEAFAYAKKNGLVFLEGKEVIDEWRKWSQ